MNSVLSPARRKLAKVVMIVSPAVIYVVWFVATAIDVSIRTSRPDYSEDYSGLGLIAIPLLAIAHYALSGILSLVIWLVSKALKRGPGWLTIYASAMLLSLLVILVLVVWFLLA
jgi:hypothetical protein